MATAKPVVSFLDFGRYLIDLPNLNIGEQRGKLDNFTLKYQSIFLDSFGVEFGETMLKEYQQDGGPTDRAKAFFEGKIVDGIRFTGIKEGIANYVSFFFLGKNEAFNSGTGFVMAMAKNSLKIDPTEELNRIWNNSANIQMGMILFLLSDSEKDNYPEFNQTKANLFYERSSINF